MSLRCTLMDPDADADRRQAIIAAKEGATATLSFTSLVSMPATVPPTACLWVFQAGALIETSLRLSLTLGRLWCPNPTHTLAWSWHRIAPVKA